MLLWTLDLVSMPRSEDIAEVVIRYGVRITRGGVSGVD
jgi:hypothetical protein